MSSPETFLAFAAIMLIIALIGVAIDWFGKPLRHRKFIPKAYKFPDERLFRSGVFNTKSSIPENPQSKKINTGKDSTIQISDSIAKESPSKLGDAISEISELSTEEDEVVIDATALKRNDDSTTQEKFVTETNLLNVNGDLKLQSSSIGIRLSGWSPGDDIYNLTQNGSEPSPSTVRSRFWKNVGVSAGASIFGAKNVERLREGKPPQRRNPRTSSYETMKVHLLSYVDGEGRTPIPNWPSNSVDPYGDRN